MIIDRDFYYIVKQGWAKNMEKSKLEQRLYNFNQVLYYSLGTLVAAFWVLYFTLNEIFLRGAVFYSVAFIALVAFGYTVRRIAERKQETAETHTEEIGLEKLAA